MHILERRTAVDVFISAVEDNCSITSVIIPRIGDTGDRERGSVIVEYIVAVAVVPYFYTLLTKRKSNWYALAYLLLGESIALLYYSHLSKDGKCS